ncbi:hypothetical protein CFAM422_012717 [Trichoderma lentiforme]|uniref:Uncharacterized protein n=1 Tax=Trichoderma lentiforme TaxID=1567552 RepID=A0A9P5C7Z2_9HYPO|nr:hypothetical protein CFAM422_012717 [Trichoderma lentiforme]
MHLVSLLSYTTILGGVVAAPAGSQGLTATAPVKRADSIHIVYCTPLPGEGSNSIPPFSAAVYCPNDNACQLPTSNNVCKIDPSQLGVGGPFSCKFPSGVTFTWELSYEAYSAPLWSQVALLARRNQRTNTYAEAELTAFNHSLDIRTTGMHFAASAPIAARRISILTERL